MLLELAMRVPRQYVDGHADRMAPRPDAVLMAELGMARGGDVGGLCPLAQAQCMQQRETCDQRAAVIDNPMKVSLDRLYGVVEPGSRSLTWA